MTDTPGRFADGDDPDDAWNATDSVLTLWSVLRRRILFAALYSLNPTDRTVRLISIADDMQRLQERMEAGET